MGGEGGAQRADHHLPNAAKCGEASEGGRVSTSNSAAGTVVKTLGDMHQKTGKERARACQAENDRLTVTNKVQRPLTTGLCC